jgi:hypothetical protein
MGGTEGTGTMPNMTWLEQLETVDVFVAKHPEIEVSPTGLAIPASCREEFHALLRQARRALAVDVIGDATFAQESISALLRVKAELADKLNLNDIVLPTMLQSFCDDVYLGASQSRFTTMLSYVQKRISATALRAEVELALPKSYRQLTLAAYEAWLVYSTVNSLQPQKAYIAEAIDEIRARLVPATQLELGYQEYSATLRLPEAVFECEQGIFGLKFELASEIDFYDKKPQRRRDFSSGGDSHGVVGRRYALLYRLPSKETVPFLADRDKATLLSPDAMLATLCEEDFKNESYCEATLNRVDILKPKKIAQFVLLGEVTAQADALSHREGSPSFEVAEIGLQSEGLYPFVNALTKTG